MRHGRVFVWLHQSTVEGRRRDIRPLMVEALLKEGRRAAALVAVRASSHDLLSRHGEAVDEYRWVEAAALDSHGASCSPPGEDSMKAHGCEYSQDDMEVVELRPVT